MALSSAVLLVFSFPNFNQPWCAWVALVPWLISLREMSSRQAFGWSYLVGLLFFLGSIWWLIHVTIVGWVVLCAYLALYFGLFGLIVSTAFPVHRTPYTVHLFVPAAWVALEYLRSHALSGFGWNLLGYSQTPSLSAIQLADLTGVWGVSYIVVLMNVAIADYLAARKGRTGALTVLCAAGCVAALWCYGDWRLKQPEPGARVRIAVVQGNIPQREKWDETFAQSIVERYERLTRQAQARQPQLIIWPETSVPGLLGLDERLTTQVSQLAQSVPVPLVVGAPMGRAESRTWHVTNSAALLGPDGAIAMRYDKLHLVPFGEFVPFEALFPWLRNVLPPIGDFVPGNDHTVFTIQGQGERSVGHGMESPTSSPPAPRPVPPFSALICFEDIFPELSRECVRRGARLLVTITNDAWFGNTAAAYQHAQASTFRAVELRVPMVRAANTGWSGCIDSRGRWVTSVRDPAGGELFVEGIAVCDVTPNDSKSFYARWGDWFAWLCLLGCLGGMFFAIMKR